MSTTSVRTTKRRSTNDRKRKATGTIGVAVVGCGYWGPNLVRNFSNCPTTHVAMVCDEDPSRLEKVAPMCPKAGMVNNFHKVLEDGAVEAVAIATPVQTHAELALAALEAGKHVLVEKPMADNVHDAEEMVRRAEKRGLTLMVDHTFIFSGPVRKMKEIYDSGELGQLYYVDSVRINLGLFQHDVNVVWDLAPHDLSIMDHLLGRVPRSLSAFGTCHADNHNEIEDVAHLNLDFGDGLVASFHVNWLSPVKVRHFILGGSKKSLVYNDLEPAERIKVYDRGITINHDPEARRGVLIGYRTGDIWSPHIDTQEPLQSMVRHFAECIQGGKRPVTDGQAGLRVVRILEAAQRSIKAQGGRLTL
jgi:predicted dehydrogenase